MVYATTGRAAAPGEDAGFTFIETLMSVVVIGVVMSALTSFFATTVLLTNQQGGVQVATQLASDAVSRVRALKGSGLVVGRDAVTSHAQWNAPALGVGAHQADMVEAWDTTAVYPAGRKAGLRTVSVPAVVNGVSYGQHWYVGRCWQPPAGGACAGVETAGFVPFFRVVVAVTWADRRCTLSACSYVTSTLVSSGSGEPIFNLNETARRPVVTNPGSQTGTVGSPVNLQLVASSAAPPLTWTFSGLPPGVTWNGGLLTGTLPATPGAFNVTASVRDNFNLVGTAAFTWTVGSVATAEPPWAYYRHNEAPSGAATLAAADTSGNSRPGTYAGRTDGPSTWWPFDEASGAVADDASGAVNTGTLVNGPGRVPGPRGTALSFNGTSTSVQAARGAVRTDQDFTVTAWTYLAATGAANKAVVSQSGTTSYGYALRYYGVANRWAFSMPNADATDPGTMQAIAATAPVVGEWVHLAGVYNGGTGGMTLYVDGTSAGTATRGATRWNATGEMQVGLEQWNGAQTDFFNGRIDEVRAYQRMLSGTEVADLAADRPALQWDFSEGSGSTTADLSGNGNTGTFGSGVSWAGSTAGHLGNAAEATGGSSSNYVASAGPALHTNASFTVSAWAYLPYGFGDGALVSQAGNNTGGFVLKYDRSNRTWRFTIPRSDSGFTLSDTVDSLSDADTDTWTHVVGVYDSAAGTIRLYINGVSQGTDTHSILSAWDARGRTEVGRSKDGSGYTDSFYGRIDSVRLYQRALSAGEVAALADNTNPTASLLAPAPMTAGVPGALPGSATAVAFAGVSNAYTTTAVAAPAASTVELWFRSYGGRGGVLMGFYANATALRGSRDRQVYLDAGGRLTYGVYPGSTPLTVRSTASYNDGAWHHVVASHGPAGIKLYVDGGLVAANPTYTAASPHTGYWRWGGGDTFLWPNRPVSDFLVGSIDEVAVYTKQLSDAQVTLRYQANR